LFWAQRLIHISLRIRTTERNLISILRDGLKPSDPATRDPSLDYQPVGVYLWRHYDYAVGQDKEDWVNSTERMQTT
jgi:hypothetical protein